MVKNSEIEALLAKAQKDGVQKFVVGAYIVKANKLLIMKRAPSEDFLPDIHEIPSGGVEAGEELLEALAREVREETGLRISEVKEYINSFDYKSSSGKKTRQFNFLVSTDGFKVRLNPAEHSEFVWMDTQSPAFEELNLSQETKKCILDAADTIAGQKNTKWITIDGIDAVGKSTQLSAVKKNLSDDFKVCCIEEFSSSSVGDLIREIIKEKQFFSIGHAGETVRTETLLLIADWLHKCEYERSKLSSHADVIVSDRGLLSLVAYQANRLVKTGVQPKDAVAWTTAAARTALTGSRTPDFNVVLTLPIPDVEARCAGRGESLSDSDKRFLNQTQETMIELTANKKNRAVHIDVRGLSPQEVTASITSQIRHIVRNRQSGLLRSAL